MEVGHNSNEQLKSIVERVLNRLEAKDEITSEIRDIYVEAKSNGFDPKALRAIVSRKRADAQKLAEHEALVETYMTAMGMM